MKARKLFLLLTILFLSTYSLFSQSYLIPINAPLNQYPITFTDVAQQQLVLFFTKNVTPGANISQVGWSVTGTAATITRIDAVGTTVLITLNTSITFAERTLVKVTYNAAIGNFLMADLTEPTFTDISAVNNAYPAQSDFSNGLYGENPPTDICAAVLNVEVTSNLIISHRYRNSIYFRVPRMNTLWMYPALVPKTDPDYVETGGVGTGIFNKTNLYAAYPDNTINCTWIISFFPYVPPQAPAPGLSVTDRQVFITIPNYKRDNGTPVPGTGDLGLNPPVNDPSTLFCVGENITNFIFTDATVFDCQLPVEPNLPNTRPRNVQFVYGTQTGAGIPNVFINVNGTPVQVTDNTGVSISGVWHVNPDGTPNIPGYTTPSGFFEGPVTQYLWDSDTKLLITPMIQTYPISHTGDFINDADVDIFDVTLRNWGPCNAYDGANPLTYLDAVTEFSRFRLVPAPPLPTAPDVTVCFGSPTTLTAVRNGPNPGVLHWYNNSDLLPVHEVGTGATYNPGALAAGVYNYWVREIGTTGQLCEGPAKQVVLTINPIPNKPTVTVTGSLTFCFDGGITSVTLTANPNTPPAITSYQWYKTGVVVGGATLNAITLNDPSQNGIYTVRTFGINPTNCPGPLSDPLIVTIYSLTNITHPTDKSVCELGSTTFTASSTDAIQAWKWEISTDGGVSWGNANNGLYYNGFNTNALTVMNTPLSFNGYRYRVQITTTAGGCIYWSNSALLTVLALPTANAGPAMAAICQGGTSAALGGSVGGSATGGTWSTPAGGTFTPAATNLNATWTPPGAYFGTATLTLTTSGGSCGTTTASKTIVVNPNPTVNVGGAMAAICQGGTSAALGGSFGGGATSAVWTDGGAGGSFANNGGATPNTATYTAAAGSGTPVTLRLTTAGGSCGTIFATKNLTVNPNPTINSGGAVAAICQGGTTAALGGSFGGGATSAVWSDGGVGGSFTNNGGLTPNTTTYTAAAAAPASVTLTLTTAGGSCGTTSANKILTVNPNPIVNVGGAMAAICQGGTSAPLGGSFGGGATSALWTDGGAGGSFSNNGGATPNTATYTAAAGSGTPVTLRLTTAGGSCGTIFATKNITVNPNPTVNVGGAMAAICQSGTTAALGGSFGGGATSAIWSDGGAGGSFTNNGGATPNTTTYTAAAGAPALVTLTLTTGGGSCGITFASKTVTINPLPVPVVSGPLGPCLGSTVAYSTPLVAGHTYLWSVNNGTISGSAVGNTVNILWNGVTGAGWVRVTETITATGCAVTTASYAVTVNPGAPGPAGAITGPVNVCYAQTGVGYSIVAVPTASNYVWTVPAGVTIVSGQGTIAIVVDFTAGTSSPKNISVYAQNGCGNGPATTLVASIYAQFTSGTIGTAQTICYNTAPAALTELTAAAGGSVSYTYRWQDSPDNITFTNIVAGATGAGYSPPVLTSSKYYRRNVTDLFCGTLSSPSILVTVNPNLTAAISGGTTPICYNTAPGTLTATGGGGTGAYTYLWYKDGLTTGVTTQTYAPGNLTATSTFYCAITSGTCGTVNTPTTTITVRPNLTAAISGGTTPICYNTSPGLFTATGGGGTGAYTYQWYTTLGIIAGATGSTYNPGNITATTGYYCAITSGTCGTVNTATTTITVYGTLTAAISGGTTPICYNTSPGLFTATGGGGTGAYTYQWYTTLGIIAGATGSTYNPGNITATTGYYCAITSGTCGTVNTATTTITVRPNLTAAISGGTTPICYNTSPGLFTATGGGGTGAYTYQWYTTLGIIAGATGSTYNPGNITATTGYYCAITSGTCGTVNTATTTITVYGTLTAAISGGTTPICYNTSPGLFTATGGGGTGAYTYLWYKDGLTTGVTTQTYAPGNLTATSTFYCAITSGTCGTVNTGTTTITVYGNLTAAISGGTTPICYNTAPGTLTATGGGGTGAYTYLWYKDGLTTGVTTQTYAPGNLTATSTFYCAITSGTCGTVNTGTTTITVYGNLTAAISGGTTPICYNTAPGTLTATGGGGTGAYTYLWYKDGLTTGVTTQTYAPGNLTATSTFYCAITSGTCGTVNTPTTTITVRPNLTAAISGGTTPICYNTSPGLFTATGGGGTGAYTYQWYTTLGIIAGATGSTYNPGNITATTGYYCAITSGTCGTVNTSTTTITVYGNLTAAISGGTTPICYNTSPGLFTATGGGGTGAYTYQWYTTLGIIAGATGSTYNPGNITATTGYYCAITSGTCGTVNTSTTTITVRPTPTATISGTATVCQSAASPNITFTNPQTLPVTIIYKINGGADNTILVGASASVNVAAPTGAAGSFIYSLVSIDYQAAPACTNAIAGTVTITVLPTPTATISGTTSVCQSGPSPDITFTNPQMLPVTVTYKINGGVDNTVAVGAGTTATVAAPTGTAGTFIYSLVSVIYQTLPACTNAVAGTATVTVRPTPAATISGTTTICQSAASPNIVFTNPQIFPVTIIYKINGGADNTVAVGAGTTATVAVPTGTAGTFIYSLVSVEYQAAPTCTNAIAGTATVTIRPTPTATISGTATVCQSGPSPDITFSNPQTLPVTVTYKINGGADNTVAVGAGTTATVAVPTGTSGTFIYSLVSVIYQSIPACTNAIAGTATVTVTTSVGTPVFVMGATSSRCQGAGLVTYTANATFTSGITYSLDVASLAGGNSINASTGEVTYLGTWSGTSIITASAGGCNGPVTSVHTVTVVALPTTPGIAGGGKTAMCRATNGQFYSVPLNPGNTYTWSIAPATPIALGGNATDNFIVLNFPNPGVYTLSVREFTPAPLGCAGPIQTLTITVYDNPVTDAGLARTICAGDPTTLGGSPTATGGSGTFTYLWTPSFGLDDATLPNPVATTNATRTYTLNVNDVISGCATVIKTVVVTVNPLPAAYNVTGPDYYCFGTSGITLTLSGSQIGVDYQLYKNAVSEGPAGLKSGTGGGLNWPNLTTGTYTIKATNPVTLCANDMNGSVTVAENPVINPLIITAVEPSCNSFSDGVISIGTSGGTGPLSYSINNGATYQSSNTFGSLPSGIYNIIVKDTRNCTVTAVQNLLQPNPLLVTSLTITNPIICFGNTNGSAQIIVTGGTPNAGTYSYQWYYDSGLTNPIGQISDEATGLAAGTYWVKVTDFNGCWISGNITLTQPTAITATSAIISNYNGSHISCNGASDAIIRVTAAGGSGALTYVLVEQPGNITGAASGIFTGLAPGTYTITVRDINLCNVTTLPVTITQPVPVAAAATVTSNYNGSQVSCNGVSDGRITVTASGGTGALSYLLNEIPGNITGSITGIFTGLPAGSYTVRVRDLNLCTVNTVAVTITAPLAVTATAAITSSYNGSEVSCNGASDGRITVTAGGGTGALSYQLVQIPGNATGFSSGVFTGVPAGSYTVRVTDLNLCNVTTLPVTIANPLAITAPITITSNYNGSSISCFGASDGIITVAATGGTGALSYVLDQNPANVTGAVSGVFTGLPAGIYTVTVTDLNLCSKTTSFVTLNNPAAVTAIAAVTSNYNGSQISCDGASDGRIAVTAAGGTGVLTFNLIEIPGNVTGAASGIFTGLPAGTYTVTVRDVNLCSITTAPVTISQPSAIVGSALVTSNYNGSQLSCNTSTDGRITVTANGGTGALTYVLIEAPLNITGKFSGVFTGLSAGSYTVRVTDLNLCSLITAPVTITAPTALSIAVNKLSNYNGRDISCFGSSDGRAEAVVSGGTGSYSYNWYSDVAMTIPIGQLTAIAINLPAGTYYVRARDANNCSISGSVALTQPVALNASITAQTNVACSGNNTGSVTVDADPATGTAPYEYSINGGGIWQPAGTFANLTAASYTVLARDINGCIKLVPVIITQLSTLTATVTKTDVSCNGSNNGTITISAPSGGSGIYQYSVDPGISWVGSGNFSNLVPATYDVRISDAANPTCSALLYPNLVITEPIQLALTSTGDILLDCNGDMDGMGTFYGSGGTMPYNFVAISSTGATIPPFGFNSQNFFNAGAGVITVTLTDFHGCTAVATINVTQPAILTPGTIGTNQVICAGNDPVQITEIVPAAGGPGAYNYQWQFATTATGTFFNIAGATGSLYTPPAGATSTLYYRRMITSGICMPVYSNVVEILVNPKPVAILTGGETICPSQTSILNVNMVVGTGPFELDIDNFGTITGYVSGANIVVSPAATTTYGLLRVRDANGCEVLSPSANLLGSSIVTVRALPAITTSPVSKIVCEFGLVTFNVTATGSDLTYQWYVNTGSGFNPVSDGGIYFGAISSTLSLFGVTRLMTGYIYHVVVTGCSSSVTSADATLTVNTVPEIIVQPKDSIACMNAGATFSVSATGTGITYQWQVNIGTGFNNVTDDANFSGSNLNTLTITNAQAAFNNYIFRVIISGTCGIPVYSNFAVLRVNIPPTVTINPVNKAICDGAGPIVFIASGSGIIDSLRWQVFSGGVWSDVHDNATYGGTTSQQLTLATAPLAFNGNQYRLALKTKCTTVYTAAATLTVNQNPVVNFSAVDPIHACGSVPLVINGNPTGGSGTWSAHLWTGDIGPLNNYFIQSPTFTSQIAGTFALNYKVKDSNGCYGNGDVTVLVDAPDASFTQDKNNGCTPTTVTFMKDMTGIAKFWWDFGDGSPKDSVNTNPVHIFTNATASSIVYYDVKLTVRSAGGCLDSFTSSVTVYPVIDATFTATPGIVCSGNQIVFTTLPGASKYLWDFGDGASGYFSNTTNHLYTNFTAAPVVHTVTLTTTSFYNCIDVKTMNITVMPVPLPQFTASPVSQIYNASGNPVTFTNTTNAGTWTWLWNFGDGGTSTDQNPTHTYTSLGTFNVVLSASNANCSDSVKHPVTITPIPPVADFDPVPSGCSPWTITLNNTSLNTNTPGTTYMWDFGDGSATTVKNPTYTYFTPGTYRIELTVTGPGGTSVKSQVIDAYPSPQVNFQVSPTTVFVNDEKVRFFNLSQGADSYLWEFGDGDTSKVEEPLHKYMEEGVYDITLWAYSNNGCSNKFVLSPGVTVEPAGTIRFSTVFTPNKDAEIDMDHLPTGGTEIDQFFFPPIREKVINYKLQIFNRLGVLIFESHDINKPWNGYYHSKLCQQGVYVWYVEGKYANGQPFKKVGDVTLLH